MCSNNNWEKLFLASRHGSKNEQMATHLLSDTYNTEKAYSEFSFIRFKFHFKYTYKHWLLTNVTYFNEGKTVHVRYNFSKIYSLYT